MINPPCDRLMVGYRRYTESDREVPEAVRGVGRKDVPVVPECVIFSRADVESGNLQCIVKLLFVYCWVFC